MKKWDFPKQATIISQTHLHCSIFRSINNEIYFGFLRLWHGFCKKSYVKILFLRKKMVISSRLQKKNHSLLRGKTTRKTIYSPCLFLIEEEKI